MQKKPVTDKEREMIRCVVAYTKRLGLEADDGIALGLLSRGDTPAQNMIDKLKTEPDIAFDDLILWAIENCEN